MKIVSVAFLLLTLAISTFFIHVPHVGKLGFLLNKEVTLSYNQYFYFVGEHLIGVILAWVIWEVSREYKRIAGWYLVILLIDFVMWFLTYDDPLKDFKITWNILKTLLFILAITFEIWRKRRTSEQS